MKHRLLKEIPNCDWKVGEVKEIDSDAEIAYCSSLGCKLIEPHDIAVLIHCGFLEEVGGENIICDHKWEVTLTDKKQFNHCTACNKCEVVIR